MDEEENEIAKQIVNKEPQVTSSDPNERKLARQLRIERRLEAIRKLNMTEGEEEEVLVEKTLLQDQLQKSYELLEKLILEGTEYVTNIRVANDSREVNRREEEELNRHAIMEQLEKEAISAEEQFNEINDKWLLILNYNDPLQINEEIMKQKEKCDCLIKQKDEVIANLKNEVKNAERKFTDDQKKQVDDIQTLASRIENQVALMRRAYSKELELIENVIMVERKILIDSNDKHWNELHKKRDLEEHLNCERKFEQLEEFEEICTKLRVNHQETYRHIKIKLGNDIENLQRELEKIKSLALINGEKLDYSYQVLKKRESENIIIKSQQKRRLNKLQDIINTLRAKTRDYTKQTNNEIEKLSEEVKKLQVSVLDIESKADSFSQLNDTKYKQVWEFNKKRVTNFLNEIFNTDRLLHEQQLGLKWINPQNVLVNKTELPSYKSAMQIVTDLYKTKKSQENKVKTEQNDNFEEECEVQIGETIAHRRILRIILQLIADKSGFLIEDKLKEVLKPYAEHEKALVEVDSVFSALEIKRKEEVEILLEYFLPYTHCPICMTASASTINSSETEIKSYNLAKDSIDTLKDRIGTAEIQPEIQTGNILSLVHQPEEVIDEIISTVTNFDSSQDVSAEPGGKNETKKQESVRRAATNYTIEITERPTKILKHQIPTTKTSCHKKHPLLISSVYILRALREFLSKFYLAKDAVITMTSRLSQKRSTISRLMVEEDVTLYWERFRIMFSSAREELWDALLIGLQRYYEILNDRKKLNDEVMMLRQENSDLNYLLTCYQKDVDKKMKPPCALQREHPIKHTLL